MLTDEKTVAPPEAGEVVREVVDAWKGARFPDSSATLEEQVRQMAWRVTTWISPLSVRAGVGDIMSPVVALGMSLTLDDLEALSSQLSDRLRTTGLLNAQPRRAGLLAS